MTEFNNYKTIAQGVYGNSIETYYVNSYGVMFCIQSPDLTVASVDAIRVADNRLPVDCVALGTSDIQDITVPEWCFDWQEKPRRSWKAVRDERQMPDHSTRALTQLGEVGGLVQKSGNLLASYEYELALNEAKRAGQFLLHAIESIEKALKEERDQIAQSADDGSYAYSLTSPPVEI